MTEKKVNQVDFETVAKYFLQGRIQENQKDSTVKYNEPFYGGRAHVSHCVMDAIKNGILNGAYPVIIGTLENLRRQVSQLKLEKNQDYISINFYRGMEDEIDIQLTFFGGIAQGSFLDKLDRQANEVYARSKLLDISHAISKLKNGVS